MNKTHICGITLLVRVITTTVPTIRLLKVPVDLIGSF